MLLMTAETLDHIYTLDWHGKDFFVCVSTLDGWTLESQWYGTAEEAVDAMPMANVGPYVPYATKDQRT